MTITCLPPFATRTPESSREWANEARKRRLCFIKSRKWVIYRTKEERTHYEWAAPSLLFPPPPPQWKEGREGRGSRCPLMTEMGKQAASVLGTVVVPRVAKAGEAVLANWAWMEERESGKRERENGQSLQGEKFGRWNPERRVEEGEKESIILGGENRRRREVTNLSLLPKNNGPHFASSFPFPISCLGNYYDAAGGSNFKEG